MQNLGSLINNRRDSKLTEENGHLHIESSKDRQMQQPSSLPPLSKANMCHRREASHGEKISDNIRPSQSYDKSRHISRKKSNSSHETGGHLGHKYEIANASIAKGKRKSHAGLMLSTRSDEDKKAVDSGSTEQAPPREWGGQILSDSSQCILRKYGDKTRACNGCIGIGVHHENSHEPFAAVGKYVKDEALQRNAYGLYPTDERPSQDILFLHTLKSSEHKATCWRGAVEGKYRRRSMVDRLPTADVLERKSTNGHSSSLTRVPNAQKSMGGSPPAKEFRKLSLDENQRVSNNLQENFLSDGSQAEHNLADVRYLKELRLDGSSSLPNDSVQQHPLIKRLQTRKVSPKHLNEKLILSDITEKQGKIAKAECQSKRESLQRETTLKGTFVKENVEKKLLLLSDDHNSSQQLGREAKLSHRCQLLRGAWSTENVISSNLGTNGTTKTGNETFGKKKLSLDSISNARDELGQVEASKIQKAEHKHGNEREFYDPVQKSNLQDLAVKSNRVDVVKSLKSLSKGKTERNDKKLHQSNNMEESSKVRERGIKLSDIKETLKRRKIENLKYHKGFNKVLNNPPQEKRMLPAKELLRKTNCNGGSDDDSYSDNENWKDIKIIMKTEKIKGILRKARRANLKRVTFNNKVKMKILYCL